MLTATAPRARILTFLAILLGGGPAHAHFMLLYPPARAVALESAPCGATGSARGSAPTVLRPGQTITVRWNVQVDHLEPPKFRIALDDAGQDFPTPVGAHDSAALPLFLDGVLTAGGGLQTMEIALPNIECDNCTFQMLQYLSPGPPYPPGSFYYQCADIILSGGAPMPMEVPAPVDAARDRADASAPASPDVIDSRPDAGSPPALTGGVGCRYAGDAGADLTAPVLVAAALLAWARRRSTT